MFWASPRLLRTVRHPWTLGVLGVTVVLLLWLLISSSGVVDKLFLPSPQAVWQAGI